MIWLELLNFRNLSSIELHPVRGELTVVTGDNGSGKTSLLEAISYGSTLRSFRRSPRESLIKNGCERAIIRLQVESAARTSLIEVEISPHRRDQAFCNRQRVSRTNDLLEALRVTVFSPDDLVLVKGPPQERRDYLDDVLLVSEAKYTSIEQNVERVLRQRAALLRQMAGRFTKEAEASLDVWDAQLDDVGTKLVIARERLVEEVTPVVASAFAGLSRIDASLQLRYQRSFKGELGDALRIARDDDVRRAVTTVGPHRDELCIEVGGLDARTELSQGQQRAVALALRLGAHEVVTRHSGTTPMLLLDDAFSELDETTAAALVKELPAGQAILTTASPLPEAVKPTGVVRLRDGTIRV